MVGLTSSRESYSCWYLELLAEEGEEEEDEAESGLPVDVGDDLKSEGQAEDDEYSEVGAVECEAYESLLLRLRESPEEAEFVESFLLGEHGEGILGE